MDSPKKKKRRKRIYLVNRDFQFRYTGAAVVVGLMSTLLTIVILLYPLYQFEILRIPRFLPVPILLVMALAACVNIVLVALMGIFVTHKMAGPMYSMVRQFRRVEAGNLRSRMGLRQDDELRYLVRNFNAMLDALQAQSAEDCRQLEAVLASLDTGPGEARVSAEKLLDRMRFRIGAEPLKDIRS